MATNLAIDDRLIEEARRIGKHNTKKAAVSEALEEYIQRHKQLQIVEILHVIDYGPDYGYKAQRTKE